MRTRKFEITDTHVKIMLGANHYEQWPIKKHQTAGDTVNALIAHYHKKEEHDNWLNELRSLSNEEKLNHRDFAYTRSRSYGITIYAKSKWSPTGVESIGGMSKKEADVICKTSPLSPVEDLRTAKR